MPNAAPLTGPALYRHHDTEALRCRLRADRWRRAAVAARDGGALPAVVENARDRVAFWNGKAAKHEALAKAALRGWVRCMGCGGSGLASFSRPAGVPCDECGTEGYVRSDEAAA
jgi:hypothetical protein